MALPSPLAGARKPGARRTTLAAVAALAGVSVVAVSYALRNNPKISAATRKRVHRAAQKLGYVPDPELRRLMYLLRVGRPVAQKASIALLSFDARKNAEPHHYRDALLVGIRQRCQEIGYNVDSITIAPGELPPPRLTAVLRNRGIQGILIPPMPSPVDFTALLDWSCFSVVAATYTAQNISVNRVVPNHLHAGSLAMTKLEAQGYQRIGLVREKGQHERENYAFLAAFALHQHTGLSAPVPAIQFDDAGGFLHWLRTHRPDVILTVDTGFALVLRAIMEGGKCSPTPIALLNHTKDRRFAGVYLYPEIVGRKAVDLISVQMQQGERGYAEHPSIWMVEGSWLDAEPAPAAPQR